MAGSGWTSPEVDPGMCQDCCHDPGERDNCQGGRSTFFGLDLARPYAQWQVASAATQGDYLTLAHKVEMTEDNLTASSCPSLCWQGVLKLVCSQPSQGPHSSLDLCKILDRESDLLLPMTYWAEQRQIHQCSSCFSDVGENVPTVVQRFPLWGLKSDWRDDVTMRRMSYC